MSRCPKCGNGYGKKHYCSLEGAKTFIHKKTYRLYVVTGEVNIQDRDTREWVKGYMYAPVLNPLEKRPLLMYVWPQKEFHERFVELIDGKDTRVGKPPSTPTPSGGEPMEKGRIMEVKISLANKDTRKIVYQGTVKANETPRIIKRHNTYYELEGISNITGKALYFEQQCIEVDKDTKVVRRTSMNWGKLIWNIKIWIRVRLCWHEYYNSHAGNGILWECKKCGVFKK